MSTSDTPAPAARPRRNYRRLVMALVIFVCGALVGAGGALIVVRGVVLHGIHNPEDATEWIVRGMGRRLDLTPEQREGVSNIFHQHLRALESIRSDVRPRVDARLEAMRDEIAALLNEKQAAQWKRNFDTMRKRWTPFALVPDAKPDPR
jgi:hypothetical protein